MKTAKPLQNHFQSLEQHIYLVSNLIGKRQILKKLFNNFDLLKSQMILDISIIWHFDKKFGTFFRIYSDENTNLQSAFSNEAETDTFHRDKLILTETLFKQNNTYV